MHLAVGRDPPFRADIPAAYRPLVPVTGMARGYWWNGYDYQRLRVVSVCQRWILARTRDPASRRHMLWMPPAPVHRRCRRRWR